MSSLESLNPQCSFFIVKKCQTADRKWYLEYLGETSYLGCRIIIVTEDLKTGKNKHTNLLCYTRDCFESFNNLLDDFFSWQKSAINRNR
jgi:hypothetical protein